ncbi:ATP-dependent DNA helicase RecG [Pseudonocardia sediminis]|uniref:ATP-dependent DNA helicase RecG n=1 Tax=Pseudonocardia sediminis TaxID=1397368 RepID=A0A4V2FRI6_PSEST|nr:ATP-binding protein [Pseudonocardia sediminis]RZT88740.1 ATP-dependent DNA helicase RecG [Pseudonocardia sediminis]
MDPQDLELLLTGLRQLGGEPTDVEVKRAEGGLPTTVAETASAFSNGNGGLIVLGVDEPGGFVVVDVGDPVKLRNDLASALSDQLEPPVRASVEMVDTGNGIVVVAEIVPLPSDLRPCFVVKRGIANGSYVRTGDGDRRMTQAEIGLAIANRGQPTYDIEPVTGAGLDDLDPGAVGRMLERARSTSRSLRDVGDEVALSRLRVIVRDESGEYVPSLGGLLALGEFPQKFFPQLMVSLVVYPGSDANRPGESPRFLDNPVFRGSIPELVSESVAAIRRNIAVRGFVTEAGRQEQLDYPMEAVREAVVNALLHRDYSPVTRGTQILIELHPDRLIVRSPGDLFGPVTLVDLGEEGVSSSRNSYLAQLLSDTYMPRSDRLVAENRASGIPTMIRELRRSGQARPRFVNPPGRFEVRLARSELMDPDTRRWLDEVRRPGFTQLHDLALALLAHGQDLSNADLREYGADRVEATGVLGDLVATGLATRTGGRRYARYRLAGRTRSDDGLFPDPLDAADEASTYDAVVAAFRRSGRTTAVDLARETRRSRPTVLSVVRQLMEEGLVRADGAPTSPRRGYVWQEPRTAGDRDPRR